MPRVGAGELVRRGRSRERIARAYWVRSGSKGLPCERTPYAAARDVQHVVHSATLGGLLVALGVGLISCDCLLVVRGSRCKSAARSTSQKCRRKTTSRGYVAQTSTEVVLARLGRRNPRVCVRTCWNSILLTRTGCCGATRLCSLRGPLREAIRRRAEQTALADRTIRHGILACACVWLWRPGSVLYVCV